MKKIKTLTLTLLLGVILVSCKTVTPEDARKYNEDLIAAESALAKKETAFIDIVYLDTSAEAKKAVYNALVKQVGESIEALNKMGSFDGNSDYQNAAKEYFGVTKSLCDNEYKKILDITLMNPEEITDEHEKQNAALADAVDTKSAEALKKVQAAQVVFATKYGFTVGEIESAVAK